MNWQQGLPFPTIYHIGASGGKDSTALLLWAVHESGYPKDSLRVSFCDTGNEHPITYQHVKMLSEKVFPIRTLKPERDFFELAKWKKRFPSSQARFCTQFLKMIPTQEHIFELSNQGARVILHSGVRADESEDRAKLIEREFDPFFAMEVFRPLLRWKIEDVWAIHKKYGIEPNPLYAMGAKRVGCFPCIMSRKSEIRLIAKKFPATIDRIRQAETEFDNPNGMSTFFARNTVPERFRTKEIVTAKGETMKVATIDDVVRWSMTGKRAQGVAEESDDVGLCPSKMGACE